MLVSLVAGGAVLACGAMVGTAGAQPARTQPAAAARDAVKVATGSGVLVLPKPKGPMFDITKYGAVADGPAVKNTEAINAAIDAAAAAGGGTVVVPAGTFKTYSIRLKSNVGLHFASADSVIRAAVSGTGKGQDGGNYDAPEKNLFVGLQDGGHSHWANSLIYGIGVSHVMISGPGLIDGSYKDANGVTVDVLSSGDGREGPTRASAGPAGGANKAIGLMNSSDIIFSGFRVKNGGHFAILGTGVDRWTIDGIVVDTDRDAIDIDTVQNMTVRNSVFNSLNDDALVMKGSFALGKYQASKNLLFEKDTVSGYDPGSVLDKVYSTERRIASDRDGPTGRVKFGTEGTNGLDTVTIRNVTFDRSRGFCLESVDGAELKNILFTDIKMKHISSSPIFLYIGDRGRAPVTGTNTGDEVSPANNVRLNDTGWILPNVPSVYGSYPPVRYVPSYDKTAQVPIGGASRAFSIVNPNAPARLNAHSIKPDDPAYANAVGVGFAVIKNVVIRNVVVEDADPRYPILLSGLVGHPVENVSLTNVTVQYRGGLTMEHAVEQRQLTDNFAMTPYQGAPGSQGLPWLVNTFFSKNEALLPRVSWDATADGGKGAWADDPYNVPEMPREYPEPSVLGILPAYGLYARHVKGVRLSGVTLQYEVEDKRPAVVLDDVDGATFTGLKVTTAAGVPAIVKVTNTRKRESELEYIKETPYRTTEVTGLVAPPALTVQSVTVDRPSPGTPPDSLYANPTAPSAAHPYAYAVADAKYPRPVTVYRPGFDAVAAKSAAVGEALQFTVAARSPVAGTTLTYSATGLPAGASFDPATKMFAWTPTARQVGAHEVTFVVNDGVLPVSMPVSIKVTVAKKP